MGRFRSGLLGVLAVTVFLFAPVEQTLAGALHPAQYRSFYNDLYALPLEGVRKEVGIGHVDKALSFKLVEEMLVPGVLVVFILQHREGRGIPLDALVEGIQFVGGGSACGRSRGSCGGSRR